MIKVTVYVFDLDNTICFTDGGNYSNAKPLVPNIKIINKLFLSGNVIKIYTARGMGRNDDNATNATLEFEDLTINQLEKWGVMYHSLHMGKPSGDYYIDDKAFEASEFFNQFNKCENLT